jgi:hypothetical protein
MDCELVQVGISKRMDGEPQSQQVLEAVDIHVEQCGRCTSFVRGAHRIRTAVRIHEAEPVPDLVQSIMAAVAAEPRSAKPELAPPVRRAEPTPAPWSSDEREGPPPRPGRRRPLRRRLAPTIAAALVVGLVIGSLSVGGPFPHSAQRQPAAQAAPTLGRRVLAEAARLDSLRASFSMVERNFAADVPVRRFDMRVLLSAPERFRLDIDDRSPYPDSSDTRNDLSYIVNGSSSYSDGPTPCPSGLAKSCPRRRTTVANRPPFSAATPVLADLVLPVTTLGGLPIRGRPGPEILGHDTVAIDLPYERAAPLFPFLTLFPALDLGDDAWRPFFPGDRVHLWLDAETLFPLRSEVWVGTGDRLFNQERRAWELRWGMLKDPTNRPLLSIEANAFGPLDDHGHPFRIPGGGDRSTEGAHAIPLRRATSRLSYRPDAIATSAGLDAYRSVVAPAGDAEQTIVAYSRGVSWLKIGETRDWTEPELFGVQPEAERVQLPGIGVAYFEPGANLVGRRLAIHTEDGDLVLETNLPRAELLDVAGALDVRGRAIPRAWRVQRAGGVVSKRVPLDEALARVPFAPRLLSELPPGYTVASAELTEMGKQTGLTVFYRQVDSDLGGGPIRLHEELATEPAPIVSNVKPVRVERERGLYDPALQRLQWIHRGVYYAIDSPGLEPPRLVELANTLRPAETGR